MKKQLKKIVLSFLVIIFGSVNFAFDCPESEGIFPNPTDCSKFFVCVDGDASLLSCPTGLHYDATEEQCDFPEDAGCAPIGNTVVCYSSTATRSGYYTYECGTCTRQTNQVGVAGSSLTCVVN